MKQLNIGIFPNFLKTGVEEVTRHILAYLAKQQFAAVNVRVYDSRRKNDTVLDAIDIAIAVGGDGTLIGAARFLAEEDVLLCGINMGSLGFLTDIEQEELEEKLEQIVCGQYTVEDRLMLSVAVKRDGQVEPITNAMNDVVIKGEFAMVKYSLFIDDFLMDRYMADGMIVATPTGSTGYSLSAGGPIVNPNLDVIVITPVCPHTLKSRPMVISHAEKVRLAILEARKGILLTVDGQVTKQLLPNDEILIEEASKPMKFLKFFDKNYYATFNSKLERSN